MLQLTRPSACVAGALCCLVGIAQVAAQTGDQGTTNGPAAQKTPSLAAQRAHFSKQDRLLFGCGIIPSKWLHRDWSEDGKALDLLKSAGGTHTLVGMPWVDVETKPGTWDFAYSDHVVKLVNERGLEAIAYMGMTPEWVMPAELKGKPGMAHRTPPADEHRGAFVEYCRQVARRYRGKVRYYRFWNEPNGCSWVNDGCGNADGYVLYAKWLKIWYTAMKAEDPDCVLAAGSLDYHDGVDKGYEYLEGLYREGAKDYFDAFTIHPYHKNGGTLHHRALRDVRRVMVEHGDWDKPVWITEYGWNSKDERWKARQMMQALRELSSPEFFYVTLANYLSLTDPPGEEGYGLCERDLTPRQSFLAFKAFRKPVRTTSRPARNATSESSLPDRVRVGGIVLKWITADKEKNYARAEPLIRQAAEQGAEIVITTECFLDGYAIRDKTIPLEKWRTLCEPIPDGPYVSKLRKLADELDIHLVAGLVECLGDKTYNTAILIGPDGESIGKYHKHKLDHELVRNSPGSEYPVFDTRFGKIGLMICADRRVPELVKKLAENGADLLICPSGGMWGPQKNDFYLQDRSRENQLPIVFVHPVEFLVTAPDGSILDRRFAGTKMALEPAQVGGVEDEQGVMIYDMPLTRRNR